MDRNLLTRLIIIVAIVALTALSAHPLDEKINLGLDLRGGIHLVLRVETDDAIRAERDNNIDFLSQELDDDDIKGYEIEQTGDNSFRVTGIPEDYDDELDDNPFLDGWNMDRVGDQVEFAMTTANAANIRELAVNQAIETIRNRIDSFGVAEPLVHREGIGGNRIVVQMPGVDDPERVKRLIKNTAFLELRLVAQGTGPANAREDLIAALGSRISEVDIMSQTLRDENKNVVGQQFWALEKKRAVTGRDLRDARPTSDDFNRPAVSFILTREGGRKFADITAASIGRNLAIVLDNNVVSAPTIQDRISDQGVIHGNFSVQEAQDLVTVLKSGALPAGLTYLQDIAVGPTLGQDSIDQGQYAGLIGLALVVVTMLVVYHLTGINAILALALNIVLVFGFLSLFDATLTLPGIAGIVLTVGMAVDANVLIFERIREELRAGRTVKSAIVAGFSKALSSIFDANVTTLIAAMFLFIFGTGPIRGFAITLSIGIAASVFTAVFVSRFIFDVIYTRRQRVEKLSI